MSEQIPLDDETIWGEPGRTAQESEEAVLPADIDDAINAAVAMLLNEMLESFA